MSKFEEKSSSNFYSFFHAHTTKLIPVSFLHHLCFSFFSSSWNLHWVIYVSFVNESRRCSRAVFLSKSEMLFSEKTRKKEWKFLEIPDKFIAIQVKLRSLLNEKEIKSSSVNKEKLVDLARQWKANVLNTSDENILSSYHLPLNIFLGISSWKKFFKMYVWGLRKPLNAVLYDTRSTFVGHLCNHNRSSHKLLTVTEYVNDNIQRKLVSHFGSIKQASLQLRT